MRSAQWLFANKTLERLDAERKLSAGKRPLCAHCPRFQTFKISRSVGIPVRTWCEGIPDHAVDGRLSNAAKREVGHRVGCQHGNARSSAV